MQPSKVHLVFVNLMPKFGTLVRAVRGAKRKYKKKVSLKRAADVFNGILLARRRSRIFLSRPPRENAACMCVRGNRTMRARCDYAYASGVATCVCDVHLEEKRGFRGTGEGGGGEVPERALAALAGRLLLSTISCSLCSVHCVSDFHPVGVDDAR